jgi:hypothetical protein
VIAPTASFVQAASLQTPLRLIFHPSPEKHVAAMAIVNVVVKHAQRSNAAVAQYFRRLG